MESIDTKNIILEADLDGKGMQNDESKNKFLKKAKEAVCLIEYNGHSGTGFFLNIPDKGGNDHLTFLITNCHVYPQNSILTEKFLDITINGISKRIDLEGRGKWTDQKMDYTCIEIKKEDNIKTGFSLDDNISKSNCSNKDYSNKSVTLYALNKNDYNKLNYSYGIIKESKESKESKNSDLIHTCNSCPGCSGGCIAIKSNNRVIGIHYGGDKENNENYAIFIKDVFKDIKIKVEKDIKKVNHYYFYYFIIVSKSLLFLLFYYWK